MKKMHPNDIGFKNISDKNLIGLLVVLNILVEIKHALPTNYINEYYDRIRLDFTFLSKEDIIYNLEFESKKLTWLDYIRFCNYIIALYKKYQKRVILYIILGRNAKTSKSFIPPFIKNKIIRHVSLININGDEILNMIKNKYKNNERLTDIDRAYLSLIPCFSTKMKYEDYLIKAAKLAVKLNEDPKDVDDICISLMLFSQTATDTKTQDKIREILAMRDGAIKRYGIEQKKQGIEQGREEGREEKKFEIAKQMKNEGYSFNEIGKFTGLTHKQFTQL